MSSVSFNPNVNTTPVEVFNETPATSVTANQGVAITPTLTQMPPVPAPANDPASSAATRVALPVPDAQVQADPVEGAQTAVAALEQMPPGSGVAASGMQQLASLQGQATALAALAATPGADPQAVAEQAGQVETQAGNLAAALRDVVENSTYPNFTDVLKELMSLAQELKEAASQVKMAAIEGKYDLQMAGAQKLRDAAFADASSREKNIEAERRQAYANAVFGAISAGAGFSTRANMAASGINSVGSGLGTLWSISTKLEASADQLTADLLRADKAGLDADATMQDASVQTADEMEEAAKKLREAALQALGTLISNHSQIMRSAAEV